MKNQRWPYHPPPYPNEALSSWLYRIASYFDTEVADLIRYEFGIVLTEIELLNLDFYTTDHLLKGLSQCTGFDIYLITSLTTQIYSPMLIDHFNRSDNTLYNHYVEQFRLFEKKKGSIQSGLTDWIPWLSTNETFIYYGCRICLQHDTAPFIRLYWRLKWLTSCPYHKILLQPVRFYNKSSKRIGFYDYDYDDKDNLEIIEPLLKLDSYTLEAVIDGQVNLADKRIHGGIWLRIIRTVIEELKLPLNSFILKHQKYIKDVWQQLDIYIRNGVSNKYIEFIKYLESSPLLHNISIIMTEINHRSNEQDNFHNQHDFQRAKLYYVKGCKVPFYDKIKRRYSLVKTL